LDLDPGLELRTRAAALRQHLRLLLPAREYIYRREDLHEDAMQDLFDDFFNLISYNQQMTTMGCMVDHIHLDKKYIQHTLPKGTICGSLLLVHFYSDCVHIYGNNLI
jgi:hypothetical protein